MSQLSPSKSQSDLGFYQIKSSSTNFIHSPQAHCHRASHSHAHLRWAVKCDNSVENGLAQAVTEWVRSQWFLLILCISWVLITEAHARLWNSEEFPLENINVHPSHLGRVPRFPHVILTFSTFSVLCKKGCYKETGAWHKRRLLSNKTIVRNSPGSPQTSRDLRVNPFPCWQMWVGRPFCVTTWNCASLLSPCPSSLHGNSRRAGASPISAPPCWVGTWWTLADGVVGSDHRMPAWEAD